MAQRAAVRRGLSQKSCCLRKNSCLNGSTFIGAHAFLLPTVLYAAHVRTLADLFLHAECRPNPLPLAAAHTRIIIVSCT